MAYNKSDRFPLPPTNYRLLEPGAYQNIDSPKVKPNKTPFLSSTERKTLNGNLIWTHAIYHADQPPKIPNCTSLMSKRSRFPYAALSKEDLEAILCKCGFQKVCECLDENKQDDEKGCHAKIQRRLYKGPPPRSAVSGGLSAPSRRDGGFKQMLDGTLKRIFNLEQDQSPPFYDAKVNESTAFYQGCKWSQWKSTHAVQFQEKGPGPADYNIVKQPTYKEICAEKVREQKRKYSKQLRYIEMIQQREFLEGHPGPATYSPQYPSGAELQFLGPKAERFHGFSNQYPGPADHWIKRDFDPPEALTVLCQARLPERSCFSNKAPRFKLHKEEGPSPATYTPSFKQCHFVHCSTAAFGSSAQRFKGTSKYDITKDMTENEPKQDKTAYETCSKPTWEFKSKTIRMKPLLKDSLKQSPSNFSMKSVHFKRSEQLQYISPFHSSEGRFQAWYNWMTVLGRDKTPGPGYYNPEKHSCLSAVWRGPLSRSKRFSLEKCHTPAPNEYKVGRGVETILATHNQRLRENIKKQHKFRWKSPVESKMMSMGERQIMLLTKSINMLETDGGTDIKLEKVEDVSNKIKPKLLRCFLYKKQIL